MLKKCIIAVAALLLAIYTGGALLIVIMEASYRAWCRFFCTLLG